MFTSGFLNGVRRRALRRGVWFRALDRVERGILVLTSRVVDVVRSERLGCEIVKILAKLREALKSGFVRIMESYGLMRAREISGLAIEWGYGGAWRWAGDPDFARHLTCVEFNKPSGRRARLV